MMILVKETLGINLHLYMPYLEMLGIYKLVFTDQEKKERGIFSKHSIVVFL